jgi:hypothetical protein
VDINCDLILSTRSMVDKDGSRPWYIYLQPVELTILLLEFAHIST